jgi:hypothetical protein
MNMYFMYSLLKNLHMQSAIFFQYRIIMRVDMYFDLIKLIVE